MCEPDSITMIVFLVSAILVIIRPQTRSRTYPDVFKISRGGGVGSSLKSSGLPLKILALLANRRKHILKRSVSVWDEWVAYHKIQMTASCPWEV